MERRFFFGLLRLPKFYSQFQTPMGPAIATYEEIKDLPNHPDKILIDVREPAELQDEGRIPTSINIPLNTLVSELNLSDEEFKMKYNRQKPQLDTTIIFSCRSGVRAGKAAEKALSLGFTKSKTYEGSWNEWAQMQQNKNQQIEHPNNT